MKKVTKYMSTIVLMYFLATANILADTKIEGLPKQPPSHYDLILEIFGNDAYKFSIRIHPVNVLSILYYSNRFVGNPKEILKTKITNDEYKRIYQKTYNAFLKFKIPKVPHRTEDASHFKLSLNVNRREISVTYYSYGHVKEVSRDFHDILEIVNSYLPVDKKLKF